MPLAIPKADNNWLKRLLTSQNVFELLTLKEGDVIYLTNSSLILVNIRGILSTVKKYTEHKSFIFALSPPNTLLYYKTNKSICYHKVQALKNSYVLILPSIDKLTDKFIRDEMKIMEFESLTLQMLYLDGLGLLFTQNTIVKRVLVFLLILAKHIGLFFDNYIVINIGLSHTYLAEALGTTRVSITRSFQKLDKEFIIVERKKITILNPIALADCVLEE